MSAQPGFSELATECFAGTLDGASELIVERAVEGAGGYVCFCNVHVLSLARREPALRAVLSEAWLRLPDGAPVAWLQRRLGHKGAERVGGPDVMPRVLELGQTKGVRHFFLGSTPSVLESLERHMSEAYPKATIAGSLSPPFGPLSPDVSREILQTLRASSPNVVWVGLGAPKQEYWMQRVAAEVPSMIFLGTGAAFDFLAGTRARAPVWMRRSGLEWLHRFVLEPKRLSGRYLRTNSDFVVQATRELAKRRTAS